EPLMAMTGGAYGADQFTRRVLAMHAWDRLMIGVRIFRVSFIVPVDPQPMHLPTAGHFSLADHRNTVFGLARDHTSIAADASAHIDGHAPGVTFVFEARVKRVFRFVVMFALREVRVLPILLQGRRAHQIAAFHAVMELCAGEHVLRANFADLYSGSKA